MAYSIGRCLAAACVVSASACAGVTSAGPDSLSVRHNSISAANEIAVVHCAGLGKSPEYDQANSIGGLRGQYFGWRTYRYSCVTLPPPAADETAAAYLASANAAPTVARFNNCLAEAYADSLSERRSERKAEAFVRERCPFHVKPLEPAMASLGGMSQLQAFVDSAIAANLQRYAVAYKTAHPEPKTN
jgi:hypothetical protein